MCVTSGNHLGPSKELALTGAEIYVLTVRQAGFAQ